MEEAACGEVAREEALHVGQAYGQGMEVLAQAGQAAADVGSVSTNVRSDVLDVGPTSTRNVAMSARNSVREAWFSFAVLRRSASSQSSAVVRTARMSIGSSETT